MTLVAKELRSTAVSGKNSVFDYASKRSHLCGNQPRHHLAEWVIRRTTYNVLYRIRHILAEPSACYGNTRV